NSFNCGDSRRQRKHQQAPSYKHSSDHHLGLLRAAAIEPMDESRFFLVRQVDRDILSLRVVFQHALERKLAPNAAFFVATVGVTGALAETLVDLNPTSLDGVCR